MYTTMMYSCWACPISAMMVDVAYGNGVRPPCLPFWGGAVTRLIAIALRLMAVVSGGQADDALWCDGQRGGAGHEIATRLAITLMVLAALGSFDFFNKYFFEPAISFGMRGGHAMLKTGVWRIRPLNRAECT
jgi:hypothetical protein